jgi:DNA-binding FrmR family transcriptional regulator
MFIAAARGIEPSPVAGFQQACAAALEATLSVADRALAAPADPANSPDRIRLDMQSRMSRAGGHVRDLAIARTAQREAWDLVSRLDAIESAADAAALPAVYRNRDLCLAHAVYLDAIVEHLERGGQSRGSYVVANPAAEAAVSGPDPLCRFVLEPAGSFVDQHVLEIAWRGGSGTWRRWTGVRPIPEPDSWFESVWRAFREGATFAPDVPREGEPS